LVLSVAQNSENKPKPKARVVGPVVKRAKKRKKKPAVNLRHVKELPKDGEPYESKLKLKRKPGRPKSTKPKKAGPGRPKKLITLEEAKAKLKPKKAPFDAEKAFQENQRRHESRMSPHPSQERTGGVNNSRPTKAQYEKFFKVLGECANVSRACEQACISRDHVYDVKRADKEFSKRWDDAYEQGFYKFEEEAARRAFEGYEKPVYRNGVVVDYVKEYSDTLVNLMLKGRMRKIYGDRQEIKIDRSGDAPYAKLSDEQLDDLIKKQLGEDDE
jgi:hypothetical protein